MTDARKLMVTRGVRGLADGLVSIVLATYLTGLGFSAFAVGAIVTGTLLGSAAVTLAVGLLGYRLSRRHILLAASALMAATGIGFAGFTDFWPLLLVAVAGTLNPSAGDVTVFLPTEQAALAHTVGGPERTMAFAWYNVVGSIAGSVGALASGAPAWAASRFGVALLLAERATFIFYAACAVVAAVIYTRLSPELEVHPDKRATTPLAITCLLLRMAVSQMDVPARQAFVMAVVPPEERTAAASVTNVPRSLAAGLSPLLAGALLERTSFGWPLIIAGALKAAYDVVLFVQFRAVAPRAD